MGGLVRALRRSCRLAGVLPAALNNLRRSTGRPQVANEDSQVIFALPRFPVLSSLLVSSPLSKIDDDGEYGLNLSAERPIRCYVIRMRALLASTGLALGLLAAPMPAAADEVAPELETLELRKKAEGELKKLFGGLAEKDQKRLVGLYLAFDANASDPSAMVACDDDGDYVIVMTDAMAKLLANVARAQSFDEANAPTRVIEDYAAFLARTQVPGRRLLPLPPGSFTAMKAGNSEDTRLREALSFVIARELSHFRSGDLVCPHPTATHERGDDEWTSAEQRKAMEAAASVYPGSAATRDSEATVRVLDAGRTEEGALGALRFFQQLETERNVHASRFVPTYVLQHPSAATRAGTVKVAAQTHRSQ